MPNWSEVIPSCVSMFSFVPLFIMRALEAYAKLPSQNKPIML